MNALPPAFPLSWPEDVEAREPNNADKWGKVAFQQKAGPIKVGVTIDVDICEPCTTDLDKWWQSGKENLK